jgi:hypothetical protein
MSNQSDLESQSLARLGGSMPEGRHVTVHAAAAHKANGRWQVTITTHEGDATGERAVDGASCGAVTSAVSLIIALAIDPDALSRAHEPLVTPPKPPTPPPLPLPLHRTLP